MESLSAEIVELIFRNLDVLSLMQSALVCHRWKNCSYNWRFWQAFYFERWPFLKDDLAYRKAVGDQWMSLYIQMHTYSRDIICLNEVPLLKNVRKFMEEVLISPYVANKNCLYNGTASGYFKAISDRLFDKTEHKNELFSTFMYDLEFLSYAHRPKFRVEFLKVLTAAKAQGKKTLLMVNDFDNTVVGVNPIIANPVLSEEFVQIVDNYRDDIILMIYSNHPYVITEPFVKLFASCKMNFVHIQLPDAETRKELLPELAKSKQFYKDGDTFHFDVDLDVLVEKLKGANSDTMTAVINRTGNLAIRRAIENHKENEPVHVVATMDDFMEALNYCRDLTFNGLWDRDNLQILTNMVNSYPKDLKLISI